MYLLLSLLGCIYCEWLKPQDDTGVICTTEAVASVQLQIVDAEGNPLKGAEISWTVDGGTAQTDDCSGGCDSFVLDAEQAGHYRIEVFYSEETEDPCCWYSAYELVEVDVELDELGCHVITEQLTVSLTPELTCADCG